jgi:hypothetical protein
MSSSMHCGGGLGGDTQENLQAGSNRNISSGIEVSTGASSGKPATAMGSQSRSGCSAPVAHPSNDTLRSKAKLTRTIRRGNPISSNAKGPTCRNRSGAELCSAFSGVHSADSVLCVRRKSLNLRDGACITASPARWVDRPAQRTVFCFIQSATVPSITRVCPFPNRASSEAFEGLEPCEGKLSCTVLRGLDGSNPVRLLDLPVCP